LKKLAPLLALTLAAHAADAPPEEVAHTYIRAFAELEINAVADTLHPAALEKFKELLVAIADALEAAPAERKAPPKMLSALFGEEGPQAIKTRPARDSFVRFMSNLTTFVPQLREMTAGSEYQIIGHVDEGANVTHVVFRATLRRGEAQVTKMEVLSLKLDGTAWKVLLTDDLESLVRGFGKQLAAPPAPPKPAPAK
jgi:hypothetical protein